MLLDDRAAGRRRPQGVHDAAVPDGDEWVINGEKWFSSNAKFASFLIVMAVTDPDNPPYQQMSMFIVPTDTPGIEIIRNVGLGYQESGEGTHAYMRYTDVRVPAENMLGDRGGAFLVAQTRLGGGRIHHAMRTVGQVQKAFDMMCERAVSRTTQGELLGKKQMVQEMVADSWIELEQFRLLVMRTAWRIDKYKDYKKVRKDISAVKAAMPKVFHDVASRALQVHGSLGVSDEMPFSAMVIESFHMGLADGPTEVHKVTVARQVLSEYQPAPGLFPTGPHPDAPRRGAGRVRRRHRAHGRAAVTAAPPAETAPVRPGEELDWAALEAHLRANLPELEGDFAPLQFPNGSANLTYLLRFGATELVLRRPPFGTVAPGAHDMKREYRVLSKLWQIFDRAPRAYLFCDDHSVIGSDFVVMERRVGEVVRNDVPPSMAGYDDIGRRLSFALVDAMADLHLLDPADADLTTLGRPDGFVERQVSGWHTRWDLVRPDRRPAGDGQRARAARRVAAGTDPGVVRAQRPEARQLPVRPAGPRPGAVDLRLGHDDARRADDRSRHAAQLLARPVGSTERRPRQPPGPARHGPADARRDRRPLHRAHRHRHDGRPVVRGVRPVEDGRRHPAAAPALGEGREHGPADGDDRRPPAAARDDRLAPARRARRGAGLSGRRGRPVRRNRPDRAGSHGQDGGVTSVVGVTFAAVVRRVGAVALALPDVARGGRLGRDALAHPHEDVRPRRPDRGRPARRLRDGGRHGRPRRRADVPRVR